MNTGAFGENFPYSNFHDLNLDWILKIVKDFLDQYTELNNTIENGKTELTELSERYTTLLNEWYNSHSTEIATQLASALKDLNNWYATHNNYLNETLQANIDSFQRRANSIAEQTSQSIPQDYTALYNQVQTLERNIYITNETNIFPAVTGNWSNSYINYPDGMLVSLSEARTSGLIPVTPGEIIQYTLTAIGGVSHFIGAYDANESYIQSASVYSDGTGSWITSSGTYKVPEGVAYIRLSSRESTLTSDSAEKVSRVSMTDFVEDNFYLKVIISLLARPPIDTRYIVHDTGEAVTNGDARTTDFIKVTPGDKIELHLTSIAEVANTVSAYNANKNYIANDSRVCTGISGTWSLNQFTYTVPENVQYIKLTTYASDLETSLAILNRKIKITDITNEIGYQWNWQRWSAFGTSITDASYYDTTFRQVTGKYVPYLAELSHTYPVNYGIAGARIAPEVLNRVRNTNLLSTSLVTVEGGVNDHAMSVPLGTVGDKDETTFAGAIYQIAKYVYDNSNATLVFITDYVGRYVHINPAPDGSDFYGDCAPTKVNNLGLLQIDYIEMMKKQCEYFSIPCIDAGSKCGISEITGDLYLMDHIHSTEVGGKQYAQTIWDELKLMHRRAVQISE